jgi:hypothetical protein
MNLLAPGSDYSISAHCDADIKDKEGIMIKTFHSLFNSVNVVAFLAAGATPLALAIPSGPAMAQATVSGNCVAVMAHNTIPASTSGQNPLFGGVYSMLNQATGPVARVVTAPGLTGPTGLGQVCHNTALSVYQGNKGWSDPAQFCARKADGKRYRVQLLTILTEIGGPFIGHTGGYNQIAGYDVTCAGPVNVVPLTRQVVPAPY